MKVIDRDSFILANQGLVIKIANRFRWAVGKSIDFDDLVQVGFVGLIHAVDRYDSTKNYKFSTYAAPLIDGEIRNYLRDKSRTVRIPAHLVYLITKIVGQGKTHLESHEIAKEFGCSESMAEQVKLIIERGDTASLDATIFNDGDDPMFDFIMGDSDYSTLFVNDFLDSLDFKLKTVVIGKLKGKTEREISIELGVSRSLVNLLKNQAANKLKEYMEVV